MITPLIGEDGRSLDPSYQQILHGEPAADFSSDELIYLPRNLRAHKLYGFSPVEQIALTVNIALRREAATLDDYRAGSTPDAFATLPKEWTDRPDPPVPRLFRRADERKHGAPPHDQAHVGRLPPDRSALATEDLPDAVGRAFAKAKPRRVRLTRRRFPHPRRPHPCSYSDRAC